MGPPGLRLAEPHFYLMAEAESSFRNVVVLQFYNLDNDKSSGSYDSWILSKRSSGYTA